MYSYTKIRDNIWQIREDDGVFCTLLRGRDKAILWDTGYGNRNLRAFVEDNISTPYLVINSHGHPDHCLGNHWFDTVYAKEEEWDLIKHFTSEETGKPISYKLKPVVSGTKIDLGDMIAEVVDMEGHTKGSIGLLLKDEKLLLAGDALNSELWLFNYGALTMKQLYAMFVRIKNLEFDEFICGHYDRTISKKQIEAHMKNIENLVVDKNTKKDIFGIETYSSTYCGKEGTSKMVFSLDRL